MRPGYASLVVLLCGCPLACGSTEDDGQAAAETCDVPDGWTCDQTLSVVENDCLLGDPALEVLPTSDGSGILISGASFRCEQELCAYLAIDAPNASVLLEPCDMNPTSVAKCSCQHSVTVALDLPAEVTNIDVYTRQDSYGGGPQDAVLVGSISR